MITPQKESDVQKDILEYLNHFSGCMAWNNHNTGVPDRKSKSGFRKIQLPGISDILGLTSKGQGRMIAIEVKRPGEKLSLDQDMFLKLIRQYGGVGIVAYSLDDVIKYWKENKLK